MFDKLFKRPSTIACQLEAPLASERASYLRKCAEDGAAPETLLRIARELLVVVRELDLTSGHLVTLAAVDGAAEHWAKQQKRRHRAQTLRWSQILFRQTAIAWLSYLGRLCISEPESTPQPFAPLIDAFVDDLQHERGLSTATVANYQWHVQHFFADFSARQCAFAEVRVEDVDAFLARQGAHWCRVSIASSAKALRAFFRYAERQGWCRPAIASAIESPRLFRDETLPGGPAWEDIRQLIPPPDTQQPRHIRDRAILLLFAVYALRSGEVARLRLDDIDWTHACITVVRAKQHCSQRYPLTDEAGSAIVRYLQEVRPCCGYREVFLTLRAPIRPLSAGGLYHVTCSRLHHLGVQTPHWGPHALRHACACHLLAEGLSLDAIGDHLGHHSLSSTRHYAKVDLAGLREVAEFDVGGLL
ncbi:tyrosine-type recombinase/integrase [Thiorhodococcus minor]|uniref:Tyrosine-type recombinase/integrase n=1 Tax=Thiorhodococcus minor TaxID=57489 RepID=A0A6M0K8E3_9GAMM|nr:tyrosine-type recombinase/integrase [Thiorhodococcus minor]NEV65283.1 tyrosine-type recombinase/integrase [Thiorhodococcus minor]